MAITIREAEKLVTQAIERGHVLTARAYSGEGTVTVGPYQLAVGRGKYASFWYKRRQESFESSYPGDAAAWFVERVGRGAAGRVARDALSWR